MSENVSCACSAAPKLILAYAGAADVGEVADHVARRLRDDGHGMTKGNTEVSEANVTKAAKAGAARLA